MKFKEFPKFVYGIESPIKWLVEYLSSSNCKADNTKLFESLEFGKLGPNLDEQESDDSFEDTEPFSYHLPKIYTYICSKINLAAAYIYVGEMQKSCDIMNSIEVICAKLVGDHKTVRKVTEYIIGAIRLILDILQADENGIDHDAQKILAKKWETLMSQRKTQAVIEFMKACLLYALGVTNEEIIKLFEKIVDLDPKYFLWHHYLYRIIRRNRIESQDKNKMNISPGVQEINAIEESYNLRPGILLNIYWLAKMVKRKLLTMQSETHKLERDCNSDFEIAFENCLRAFSDALEIAKLEGIEFWVTKITQEKGSVMTRYSTEKKREELLDSPIALNEIGNFHEMKARRYAILMQQSLNGAQIHYKQALLKHPGDFNALLNYINFLKFLPYETPTTYVELLMFIEKALKHHKGLEHEAELEILRGCLIWVHNPLRCKNLAENRIALHIWLDVLKKFPEKSEKLFETLREPPFMYHDDCGKKKEKADVNHLDLVLELNQLRIKLEASTANRDEATLRVIFNLWVMGDMELPEPPPDPVERKTIQGNLKHFQSSGKYCAPHQRSNENEANMFSKKASPFAKLVSDKDNNWQK